MTAAATAAAGGGGGVMLGCFDFCIAVSCWRYSSCVQCRAEVVALSGSALYSSLAAGKG